MNDPLRIAICEDTAADAEHLLDILGRCGTPVDCAVFPSGEALLEVYQPQAYDLLLTDIYMGGISGVETVTRIRETDPDIPVAFITTSTDHTLEGYRLSALKYIEKPYQEKDIRDMVRLALLERSSAPALAVLHNGQVVKYRLSRITCLEQHSHLLTLYLSDGSSAELREKLSDYLPLLENNDFFLPHKSFAVNLSFVRAIDPELKSFIMQGGQCIPIRRESMARARQALKDYLFARTRGGGA